jgi:hypothetical protein
VNSETQPQETPIEESSPETEAPEPATSESVEQPVEVESAHEVALVHGNDEGGYGAPRGALAFVLVMLVGYILYWIMIYSDILGHGR